MREKNFVKILVYMFLFLLFQTYFQNSQNFNMVISKWMNYFVPLIWGGLIAVLLDPMVTFFEKRLKLNKTLSVIIVFSLVLLLVVILILMIVPQIILTLKELERMYPYILEKTKFYSEELFKFFKIKNTILSDTGSIFNNATKVIKDNVSNIQQLIVSVLKNLVLWTAGISNFILGLLLAVMILLEKESHINTARNIIKLIFGEKRMAYVLKKINMITEIFLNYISGKIIVSFIVGLTVFVILFITKTPYALLSGVLLGLGNMIPYVGPIVVSIIVGLLIAIVSPYKILYLGLAIFVSQIIDGFILGPKIIGEKVGLSAFWVFISMIIFGGLFGIIGVFLGVPLMCIVKMFYRDLLLYKDKKERELMGD